MKTSAMALLAILCLFGSPLSAQSCEQSGDADWTIHHGDGKHVVVGCKDGTWIEADQLKCLGEKEKGAYLGVTLGMVDEESAKEAGLKKKTGAMVLSVFDDTPADEAGIEAGDIIVKFDGKDIGGVEELVEMVRAHETGDKVKVRARRDGKKKDFKVTLGEREQQFSVSLRGDDGSFHFQPFIEKLHMPEILHMGASRGRLGVEVRDLDDDLAEYFPGSEKGGALVLSVVEDTPAEKAGLKPGDVILGLGEHEVDDVGSLKEAVGEESGAEGIELRYLRKGKRKTVAVDLEKSKHEIAIERFRHKLDDTGDRFMKRIVIEEHELQEKLEQLEKKLEELEEKLEDAGK